MIGSQQRPYTICHVLSSVTGKISGDFMRLPVIAPAARAYARIRLELGADAWLYGTTTALELSSNAHLIRPVGRGREIPEGDYIFSRHLPFLFVSVDPTGLIGWDSGVFRRAGCPDAHIVSVLANDVPKSVKRYHREHHISYILAGHGDDVDCQLAMHRLAEEFDVRRLLVCGGGKMDGAFLRAGLIDELSLVVAPAMDGSATTAGIFDIPGPDADRLTAQFELEEATALDGGAVHLRYKRAEESIPKKQA